MNNYTKKLLCYAAFISLLNTSFYPLYAGSDEDPSIVEESNGLKINSQALEKHSDSKQERSLSLKRHAKRALGDEFLINQVTSRTQQSPSVTVLSNGNVFTSWGVTA